MATKNDPYRFTKADQPKENLRVFWTLGAGRTTKPLRMNVTAPVQTMTNYLRDAMDPNVGEVGAGWTFLEAVMPAEDYEALNTWPMTHPQFMAVGRRAFSMVVHEGDLPEDEDD
jgi:hypothetical protein